MLALEFAETAGKGEVVEERDLTPALKRLCFVAPVSFGEGRGYRRGVYHTLITKGDPLTDDKLMEDIEKSVARSISMICSTGKRRILVVGLGNPNPVVDALGAETVKRLSVGKRGRRYLGALVPSVYGLTGLETASVVRGVAAEFCPDLILSVDTLATSRAERLSRAVQITDGGVVPGGGVGNRRAPLCKESLGVPVLSLGVSLLARFSGATFPTEVVVTPKEIDLLVPRFAAALACGVERALFRG